MAKFFVNVNGKLEEVGKGNSAYDIAVYNGYTGTEKEWLESLKGKDGEDGSTVTLNPTTKHWEINGVDTGVVAEGTDGSTPTIDSNTKHWMIDGVDTGIVAEGTDGTDGTTPTINPDNKHWMIGTQDTGIIAEGTDGKDGLNGNDGADGITPHIDSESKHWFIGETDTNIVAEGMNGTNGTDGVTPHIGENNNWFIGDVDTGILAQGTNGTDGKDGKSIKSITKDENNNIITTFTDGTTQNIGRLSIDVQSDFLTEDGFGNLRYYNGVLQYYDTSTSAWVDTSITPDNVYIMNMTPQTMNKIFCVYDTSLQKYKLKFEEPADTIINDQVACVVDRVVLRRKLGSAPVNETDGELVTEIKRKDFGSHKNQYFVDTELSPNDGDVYYYKAFPMSTTGFYNYSTVNETSGTKCKNYNLFGFTIDQNESNPANMITYIEDNKDFTPAYMDYTNDSFNYGDWKDSGAWFIEKLKPCMLKYDGTVDYELDKNDYSKKADGTDSDIANDAYEGNAMIGFPKTYWKVINNEDNTVTIRFSDVKLDDDFVCWSHLDNNGNEIDYCYMPIYTGSVVDGRLRSLSGKANINSQTGTTEINYAKANNLTDDVIWYTEVYSDRVLVNLLLMLIGRSTDTQKTFGNGHYTGGSSASHNIASGTLNTKGLFYGTNGSWTGVKVFGMEHWWGNQWRRIAGWINDKGTQKVKLTYGQSDGSTTDGYNTDGTGYISITNSTPSGTSGGYTHKMKFSNLGMITLLSSGSATTYYCDGQWFNNSQVDYAFVGGDSYDGSLVGAFYSALDDAVGSGGWYIAAAVSCKPLA